ncbi:hypothetical protein N665_0373s0014 [Sinapis alba]|nr:hypothetical protein N665_0373s0014 [Sinapis alba]
MVITMKTLVMFVFTVFFIVSFVDCHTSTAAVTPAYTTSVCFHISAPCDYDGRYGCAKFCDQWDYIFDRCEPYKCCCHK